MSTGLNMQTLGPLGVANYASQLQLRQEQNRIAPGTVVTTASPFLMYMAFTEPPAGSAYVTSTSSPVYGSVLTYWVVLITAGVGVATIASPDGSIVGGVSPTMVKLRGATPSPFIDMGGTIEAVLLTQGFLVGDGINAAQISAPVTGPNAGGFEVEDTAGNTFQMGVGGISVFSANGGLQFSTWTSPGSSDITFTPGYTDGAYLDVGQDFQAQAGSGRSAYMTDQSQGSGFQVQGGYAQVYDDQGDVLKVQDYLGITIQDSSGSQYRSNGDVTLTCGPSGALVSISDGTGSSFYLNGGGAATVSSAAGDGLLLTSGMAQLSDVDGDLVQVFAGSATISDVNGNTYSSGSGGISITDAEFDALRLDGGGNVTLVGNGNGNVTVGNIVSSIVQNSSDGSIVWADFAGNVIESGVGGAGISFTDSSGSSYSSNGDINIASPGGGISITDGTSNSITMSNGIALSTGVGTGNAINLTGDNGVNLFGGSNGGIVINDTMSGAGGVSIQGFGGMTLATYEGNGLSIQSGTGDTEVSTSGGDVNVTAGSNGNINLLSGGDTTITSNGAGGLIIDSVSGTKFEGNIGFFSAAPVVRQTLGYAITNNVTSGGTAGTLANFTGAVYATDSAAIRNDIYQLGLAVQHLVTGLRSSGFNLFT